MTNTSRTNRKKSFSNVCTSILNICGIILCFYTWGAHSAGTYQIFDTFPLPSLYENGNFLPDSFGGNLTLNAEISTFLRQFHNGDIYSALLPDDKRLYEARLLDSRNQFPGMIHAFVRANYLCGTTDALRKQYLDTQLLNVTIPFNATKYDISSFIAGYQVNRRGIKSFPAEQLGELFNKGFTPSQVASDADPAVHERTTLSADDDGGECPENADDDDDEDHNPCNDDDDGGGLVAGGRATAQFANKCCGPTINKQTAERGSAPACEPNPKRAYDDEEGDADDEEVTTSRWPGNEGDDDDNDDDDAKFAFNEINNIGGGKLNARQVILTSLSNAGQIESLHDVMLGIIDNMNEIWSCANGILLPLPVDVTVSVPVTVYVPVFNMTTNMTDYVPMNSSMIVDTEVIANVDLCQVDGIHSENITTTVNATTQVLNMGVPQNVTIMVNVSVMLTIFIPTVDLLPHIENYGKVVPDINLINSTHLTFNMSDIFFQDFPIGVNITYPIFDPQPIGPFVLVGADNMPCNTCKRLCEPIPVPLSIQVTKRRTDKTFIHPLIPTEREVRRLLTHTTPKGEMLCELKDQIDWIRCFVRSMMYPQIERTLFCLEMFYTDGAAPNSMSDYTKLLYLLDSADAIIESIEFWYAEHGYYTQASIDYGCINPYILEYVQNCFEMSNITAPGKFGVCTTERLTNPLAKRLGACALDGVGIKTYADVRTCRSYLVTNLVNTVEIMVESIKYLLGSMSSRVGFLAELLRVTREDYPGDYGFPTNTSKCFPKPNTPLAEFVSSGDASLASLHLLNITDTSMFNITSTQT